jgi:hypothetical protein
MLCYLLVVLKTSPFESDDDDIMSVASNFSLLATLFGALLLMTDDPLQPSFDSSLVGTILIVCNVAVFVLEIALTILNECNLREKIKRMVGGACGCGGPERRNDRAGEPTSEESSRKSMTKNKKKTAKEGSVSRTKVHPSLPTSGESLDRNRGIEEEGAALRSWGRGS